jgi:hypothetical protein
MTLFRFVLTGFISTLFVLALSACTAEGQKSNISKLRVFNAVHESSALRVNANEDGDIVAQLSPATLAAYKQVKSGTQTIKVYTSAGTQILESSASLPEDGKQLLVIAGTLGNYVGYLVDDSYSEPADGKARFRILHAAVGVGTLDAYLTATTEDITQVNPTVSGLATRSTGSFVEVSSGTYKLRLTTAGSKDVIYESDSITLANRQTTSFLAYPTGSGKLVGVSQLAHDNTGTAATLASKVARFKSANGVPGVTYNVLVDGVLRLAGIPQSGLSSYQGIASGSRQIRIEPTTTPGSAIAATTLNIEPAREYTLLTVGSASSASVVAIADNTQTASTTKVRLRVINAVAGGDPVNLLVNFTTSSSNITAPSASRYVELDIGTYNIAVSSAANGVTLFSIPAQEFDSDDINKMFAILLTGTPGSVQAVLLSDN